MSASRRMLPAICLLLLTTSLHGQAPAERGDEPPAGVAARLGSFRLRHPGSLGTLAFAPDGKSIHAGGSDKVVRQWNLDSGKELRKLEKHTEEVRGLALTPDGKKLFSASLDGTLQEWDLATGKANEFGKHEDCIEALALSPSGSLLATVGRDHRIGLWNVADGDRLCWLTGHENNVVGVAFSPDSKTLASCSWDRTIRLWDAATHRPGLVIKGHADLVESLAFAPDGKILASGSKDGSIRLWDVASGKETRKIDAELEQVRSLAFTRDGKLLLAGGSPAQKRTASLRAFDPATGKTAWSQSAHRASWRAFAGIGPFVSSLPGAGSIALSADGKTAASAGADGRIRLWEPLTGRDLRPVLGHEDVVTGVVFQRGEGSWLTAGLDGTLRWWEANGKEKRHVDISPAELLAVSADGKTIVTSRSGGVTVRDAAGKKLHEWQTHEGPIHCLALARDGMSLATGFGKGKVVLWSNNGKELRRLSGLGAVVKSVVFSPDGKQIAAASRDDLVQRWDTGTGKALPPLGEGLRDVTCLAYSPDGRFLAAGFGGSRSIVLWDAVSGAKTTEFAEEGSLILALAYSPDGQTIFTAHENQMVRFWEVRTGKERRAIAVHHAPVTALDLSPDGRLLATASADQTALLISRWHSPSKSTGQLTDQRLQELWRDLASDEADRAYDAMCSLLTGPERTLSFLRPRLNPLEKVDAAQVRKWIGNLDARSFKAREEAMENLGRLGRLVEEPLKTVLEGKTSLDQRRRIEELLKRMAVAGPVEEWRRLGRAIEVVEQIGGEPAIEIMKKLAGGGEFWPTREARAALERLQRR